MIHYTCDLCGKALLVDEEVRYEVNIEVKAAFDSDDPNDTLHIDFHDEMSELIDLMEGIDSEGIEKEVYKIFRFDLCTGCRSQYMKDPLFRKSFGRLGFSEN